MMCNFAQVSYHERSRGGGGGWGVGTGGPDPTPENHKNVGFLSNTGQDPLKNHKATKPAFNVVAIIDTPAKHHLNGVLLVGR